MSESSAEQDAFAFMTMSKAATVEIELLTREALGYVRAMVDVRRANGERAPLTGDETYLFAAAYRDHAERLHRGETAGRHSIDTAWYLWVTRGYIGLSNDRFTRPLVAGTKAEVAPS